MVRVLMTLALVASAAGCARHAIVTEPATPVRPSSILQDALAIEPAVLEAHEIVGFSDTLDSETSELDITGSSAEVIQGLNAHFFGPDGFKAIHDLSGPESVSVASVLRSRRGTCMGLAVIYLAMAEQVGLDAHAVSTPDHLFIRVDLGAEVRNVELLEMGRHIDDDVYRRRHKIQDESVEAGVFMRDLTDEKVIAHLLSNQAVVLSKEGKYEEAIERYEAAIEKAPQLVAAYYNRGLQFMRTGRLEEALQDFDDAIELHPGDAEAFNNRGLTKVKVDGLAGARADFEHALELEPGLREARENLKRLAGLEKKASD